MVLLNTTLHPVWERDTGGGGVGRTTLAPTPEGGSTMDSDGEGVAEGRRGSFSGRQECSEPG